jgi:hypothetical protein
MGRMASNKMGKTTAAGSKLELGQHEDRQVSEFRYLIAMTVIAFLSTIAVILGG